MNRQVEVIVPMAPPASLLPNARRRGKGGAHWTEQSHDTAELRMVARNAALVARGMCGGGYLFDRPVIVTIAVTWPWDRCYTKRNRIARPIPDPDAVPTAAKAVLDGIVDAFVIVDDSAEFVAEIRGRSLRAEREDEQGCTVVTLQEVEA